jgi:hydroxymethylpyrimidine pyrophosphatase-like HAD family hydrolase
VDVIARSFLGTPLVALDVDGTILHHDGHLSDRVRRSVRELAAAGAYVMIATGRSVIATTYAVCSNGAVTIVLDSSAPDGYRLHDVVTFDPRPAVATLRAVLPNAIIAVEEVGVGFKVSELFPEPELTGEQRVVSEEELVAHPATRVTFRDVNGSSADFEQAVENIGLHGVNYAVGFSAWLDVAPEGVSKASALEQVRRLVGVEPMDTVAVGDQRNDLEMLRWAALGVAMGQAPQEVVDAADETTGTVEDDGLAQLLEDVLVAVESGARAE